MAKGFDIRKATGRDEVKSEFPPKTGSIVTLPQNVQSVNIDPAKINWKLNLICS